MPQSPRPAQLMQFLHAACFSPSASTWTKAISNGHFLTRPLLTSDNVRNFLPKSTATTMGHQDQNRKNLRSTQPSTTDTTNDDFCATPTIDDGAKTYSTFASVIGVSATTGKVYTDQTGCFPIQSSKGHNYIMVLYDYDSNTILAERLRNRTAPELLRGYNKMHQELVSRGLQPQLQRLDNEASKVLKQFLHDENVSFQLIPPHVHRRNAAERAMFVPLKTISSPAYAALTKTSRSISGTSCYHKPPSL
jgi:hypothetical protein